MSNISQYSTTAGNNNAASPDGFSEGMPPSGVNDSAREVMAALAKWYQDTDGSLVTAGSGNSYTLSTNNSHAALGDQSLLVFRCDRANTGSATLNVDSLGAKTIKANGDNLTSGMLQANVIVVCAYNANQDVYDLITTVSDQQTSTSSDVSFNNIDNTPIGQTTPAAVSGTTGVFSDVLTVNFSSPRFDYQPTGDAQTARQRYLNTAGTEVGRIEYDYGANELFLKANGVSAPDVTVGTNVTVNSGNLVMGTAGKGIDFSTNGGNVLTQYEEGTWTATLTDGTNDASQTASDGTFTRIGRMVHFSCNVQCSSLGSISGGTQLYIKGLPYTHVNSEPETPCVVWGDNMQLNASESAVGTIRANQSRISLWAWTSTEGATTLAAAQIDGTAILRVSGSYRV